MCGRYYMDDEAVRELKTVARFIDTGIEGKKMGDLCPSQEAPAVSGKRPGLVLELMRWGFPQYQKKGLLINARAETVLERKMFRESVLCRRCAVPARRFYEWDAAKNKASFAGKDGELLYMAGFYRMFGDGWHFVILTTEANASVRPVHERMPLLLQPSEVEDWICEDSLVESFLGKVPGELERYQEYEQQCLSLQAGGASGDGFGID